jgi:hypothetical protein
MFLIIIALIIGAFVGFNPFVLALLALGVASIALRIWLA